MYKSGDIVYCINVNYILSDGSIFRFEDLEFDIPYTIKFNIKKQFY